MKQNPPTSTTACPASIFAVSEKRQAKPNVEALLSWGVFGHDRSGALPYRHGITATKKTPPEVSDSFTVF